MPPNQNSGPAPARAPSVPKGPVAPPIINGPKGGASIPRRPVFSGPTPHPSAPMPKPLAPMGGPRSPRTYSQAPTLPPIAVKQSKAQLQTAKTQLNQKLTNESMQSLAAAMREHPQHADSGGLGGGVLGSVLNPVSTIVPGVEHVAGNLWKDLKSYIPGVIEAPVQLGQAALHDALNKVGRDGFLNDTATHGAGVFANSELGQIASNAAKNDALVQLATGHPGRALQMAGQHPLGALFDAAGAGGVLGRVAGAAARSGALGDAARAAGSTARAPKELAPGFPGTEVQRSYSPNLISASVQKLADQHPALAKMGHDFNPSTLVDRVMVGKNAAARKQASLFIGPENTAKARAFGDLRKTLKSEMPKSKNEANIVPYLTAFGAGRDAGEARQILEGIHSHYLDVKNGSEGPLSLSNAKTLDQHIGNLEKSLADPKLNLEHARQVALNYHDRQLGLEQAKADLHLHDPAELQAALAKQYARMRIPGTHYLDQKVKDPQWLAEKQAAKAEVSAAKNQLQAVKTAARATTTAHAGASRAIADVTKKLPLHPVTDSISNHLLDMRNVIDASKGDYRAHDANVIAALKDRVKAANQDYNLIKNSPRHVRGLVVEDPSALPLKSGPLKGMSVRPMSADEALGHAAAHGDVPSYIRMTNPERDKSLMQTSLRANEAKGGAGVSTAKSTTQAALKGDWTPGYWGMARSQLGDTMQVRNAMTEQRFVNRFGMKKPDGTYFHEGEVHDAIANYETQHNAQVIAMRDKAAGTDKWVLVPKDHYAELQSHFKLENPSAAKRAWLQYTHAFRNTVLPMSPKLPVMHTTENLTRGALIGANPASYRLAGNVLARMRELEASGEIPAGSAQRLQDLATPGGMGGHALMVNDENLGRLGNESQFAGAKKSLLAPLRAWESTAHTIIGGQRWLEQHAQQAALGVHMRRNLQMMGHSFTDANTAMSRYADELAHGYANPATAEDAARFLHHTMGQYNNFTARERQIFSQAIPFAPWYRNAAALVLHELPVHHPLYTAITQDVARADQPGWDKQHSGIYPDMQTFAHMGPGHWLDVGKFGPTGLEKNPIEEVGNLLVPQAMPAARAVFAGEDPFGNPFKGPNHQYGKGTDIAPLSLDAVIQGVDQALGSVAGPANSIARIVLERGSTPYNTSLPMFGQVQLKPGTNHGPSGILGGIDRVLNPFYGVYLNKTPGSSTGPVSKTGFSRGAFGRGAFGRGVFSH